MSVDAVGTVRRGRGARKAAPQTCEINAARAQVQAAADRADCRYVRTLGTLPVNYPIWGGGSFHDERKSRHPT